MNLHKARDDIPVKTANRVEGEEVAATKQIVSPPIPHWRVRILKIYLIMTTIAFSVLVVLASRFNYFPVDFKNYPRGSILSSCLVCQSDGLNQHPWLRSPNLYSRGCCHRLTICHRVTLEGSFDIYNRSKQRSPGVANTDPCPSTPTLCLSDQRLQITQIVQLSKRSCIDLYRFLGIFVLTGLCAPRSSIRSYNPACNLGKLGRVISHLAHLCRLPLG